MAEAVQVDIKPFDELTLRELHACLRLRAEVFVVGQQIYCEPDPDRLDLECHHVLLWLNNELVGTARLLPIEVERSVKVGRVAVAVAQRGKGLGRSMMRAIHGWIAEQPGRTGVTSAQDYLEPWYAELGWQRQGEPYIEADIKHIKMRYVPENDG